MSSFTMPFSLPAPKYETRGPLLLAGLIERYSEASPAQFAKQWKRFEPQIGKIARQVEGAAYGVVIPEGASSFSYMTAVEVTNADGLASGLKTHVINAPTYAAFRHEGNVGTIALTMDHIYREFMPVVAAKRIPAASFIERYGSSFDPKTGEGGFDILVPLKS